jgi:type II secretory pathway pseudopilin PulG
MHGDQHQPKNEMKRLSLLSSACFSALFCLGMTAQSHAAVTFAQDFETDTSGFIDSTTTGSGTITRVASGTNGITAQSGGFYAQVTATDAGPNTQFGGYSSVWPGGYTAQVSVYIDPAKMGSDGGFEYSVASNDQAGSHLRDFIFHVTNDASTGNVLVNADNGTGFVVNTNLESQAGTATLSSVGWYTFKQIFSDNAGALSVQMEVLDPSNNVAFTSTLSNPADLISSVVGGNRYGWFTVVGTTEPLAIDNVSLTTVPESSSALLLVAGVASAAMRRRRR